MVFPGSRVSRDVSSGNGMKLLNNFKIGNPVRVRNSTRCCKFHASRTLRDSHAVAEAIGAGLREGATRRNKSEDLPLRYIHAPAGLWATDFLIKCLLHPVCAYTRTADGIFWLRTSPDSMPIEVRFMPSPAAVITQLTDRHDFKNVHNTFPDERRNGVRIRCRAPATPRHHGP